MAAFYNSTNITSTGTSIELYQVPTGKTASFSINFCNRTIGNVKVRLAFSITGTPASSDWVEYDVTILPKDTLQRLGIVLGSLMYVFVQSDTSGVSAQIWGFLE